MLTIKEELDLAVTNLIKDFSKQNIDLNYSTESVEKIEQIIEQYIKKQENIFWSKDFRKKTFAIGGYLGEVILRNTRGTKWLLDDYTTMTSERDIAVISFNGNHVQTAWQVINRANEGVEYNLTTFVNKTIQDLNYEGEISENFYIPEGNEKSPKLAGGFFLPLLVIVLGAISMYFLNTYEFDFGANKINKIVNLVWLLANLGILGFGINGVLYVLKSKNK